MFDIFFCAGYFQAGLPTPLYNCLLTKWHTNMIWKFRTIHQCHVRIRGWDIEGLKVQKLKRTIKKKNGGVKTEKESQSYSLCS